MSIEMWSLQHMTVFVADEFRRDCLLMVLDVLLSTDSTDTGVDVRHRICT